MGILNKFNFDGVDSSKYGVYISGEATYNAPARRGEKVSIPGRNGDLIIDEGAYENIPVTYRSFIGTKHKEEFDARIEALRAELVSRGTYRRLTDTYHPDEFRLGAYREGLEVEPTMHNRAGEFDVVFDCKPQRFLVSGEDERVLGEWGETEEASGEIATFEAKSNTGIKSLIAEINPIQEGSGDPSPTNVRPISGWDSIKAYTSGKNLLWNMRGDSYTVNGITFTKTADGKVVANGTAAGTAWYRFTEGFKVKEPMVLSGSPKNGSIYTYGMQLDASNRWDTGNGVNLQVGEGNGRFYAYIYNGQTVNNLTFEPMVRLATDTDPTYEPYKGEIITKSLGRTVYGGTLDLISGELTITKQIFNVDFRGRTGTGQSGKYGWYSAVVPNIIKPAFTEYPTGMLCNRLAVGTRNETYNALKDCVSIHQTEGRIYTYIESLSTMTLAEAQAWLESNPIEVVYPLQTPEVIQLTGEQIKALTGVNNVWVDSGEVKVVFGDDPNVMANPTLFEALPLIEVTGQGSLFVDGEEIVISGNDTKYIDSEIMEVYAIESGEVVSKNDQVVLNEFPKLGKDTRITWSGLSSVKVIPRWWTL